MKKTRLFGMLALAVALVFGAASCAQDAGSSQSSQDDSKDNSKKDDSKSSWDDLYEVLDDGEDLSGTWKITKLSGYIKEDGKKRELDLEDLDDDELEYTFTTKRAAKAFFTEILEEHERTEILADSASYGAKINGECDEIRLYFYYKVPEEEIDVSLTFTKQ